MNLVERLEQAWEIFSTEYTRVGEITRYDRNKSVPASSETLSQMSTLGIAIAVVRYFSPSQIEEFVEQNIAHPSTLRGGSLSSAVFAYKGYLAEPTQLKLDNDDLEQLYRTCRTAKNIVEKGLF